MQGTDGHYFKFSASVELRTPNKTVGKPSQVYIAFKKIDYRSNEQLQINAQAIYNEEVKRFVGTVDFSNQFDLVNGKYSVELVA